MSEETTTVQATVTPVAGQEPATQKDDKTESELARARSEAANYRTKLRELEGKWKEAEPVLTKFREQEESQKTEAQKAMERAQAAEAKVQAAEAKAARAEKQVQLTRLATQAGVSLDLIHFLDLDKLDLEDEKKALETLGKLAKATPQSGASNPARGGAIGASDAELRGLYFGGGGRSKTTIFGG